MKNTFKFYCVPMRGKCMCLLLLRLCTRVSFTLEFRPSNVEHRLHQ